MNLKEITKQLKEFDGLLTSVQSFDFITEIGSRMGLSEEDKKKLEFVKKDPNFLSLIDKKADSKEIEKYIKTIK